MPDLNQLRGPFRVDRDGTVSFEGAWGRITMRLPDSVSLMEQTLLPRFLATLLSSTTVVLTRDECADLLGFRWCPPTHSPTAQALLDWRPEQTK